MSDEREVRREACAVPDVIPALVALGLGALALGTCLVWLVGYAAR